MKQLFMGVFLELMRSLERTEKDLATQALSHGAHTEISDDYDKYIRTLMKFAREECNRLEMKEWVDEPIIRISLVLVRINGYSRDTGGRGYLAVGHEIRALRESIEHSLNSRLFLFLTPENAAYYDKDDLFGIQDRFPEASKEITMAGNCYATGSYTACVFHLMRAVEYGARTLVSYLKVRSNLPHPVELCDWGTIYRELNKSVNNLPSRSSVASSETKAFYSHAVAQFGNFKDAWRNKVSHTRVTYREHQAMDIMLNVRQLMQHLATRLKEK